jgi:hypothetical protein
MSRSTPLANSPAREKQMTNSRSGDVSPAARSCPVEVKTMSGASEYVLNSAQALDCLLNRWPTDSGMYFETAKVKCEGASKQMIAGEDARDSFISGAIDAHVLTY